MSVTQSPVIAADELAKLLTNRDSALTVIDVRPAEDFAAGHIDGAHSLDPAHLNRAEPPAGGLLPKPADVLGWAGALGLTLESNIVVYDGGKATPAARALWVLNAYGFNRVHWLNGGFSAWLASGHPSTTEPTPAPAASNPALSAADLNYNASMVLDNQTLMQRLSTAAEQDPSQGTPLIPIDARSAGEFAGTDVRSARGGHMPGAVHFEWLAMFQADGTLKPDEQLLQVLDQNAIHKNTPTVVYCQTHQRSAVTYVALKHLGFDEVAALDGAWSSWGNDPTTPIES